MRVLAFAVVVLSLVSLSACSNFSAAVLYAQGKQSYDKGDFDHAISDFNEAIRLNPNDTLAIHSLKDAAEAKARHIHGGTSRPNR